MNSKVFLTGVFCLALAALQGCRHPLAIVGEGDIVERNGSGRGCSLEQFRARHDACAINEVEGDYYVNYFAKPRPGWRFVKWEGPCAPNSDFQHCRVQLPRHVIEQWEQEQGDATLPASTAVFQPISGETGHLLAGTPVAGVSYRTPTQEGVTGLDGGFQYAEGEMVTFSIGATVLGEAPGKQQVTPFDLAGSPVPTGLDIAWALDDQEHPFNVVINLAVLLQSLDRDGDPDNGIVISRGVAELLARVKLPVRVKFEWFPPIPGPEGGSAFVAQDWESFQRDPTFLHVLGKARRERRLQGAAGAVRPRVAVAALYRALNISPQIFALAESVNQTTDGEFWERYSYDAAGYLSHHEINGFGGATESWQYDGSGNPILHEERADEVGHHLVSTSVYDSGGRLTQLETDFSGNNAWSRYQATQSHVYDSDGNPLEEIESRAGEGGTQTYIDSFRYTYDPHGRLSQYVSEFEEQGADGSDFHSIEYFDYAYDAEGNLRRHSLARDALDVDGVPETIWTRWYNKQGNVTRFETIDTFIDDEPNKWTQSWQYNSAGRVTRFTAYDRSWTFRYQYNEAGQPTRREKINTADHSVSESVTWRYDDAGRVVFKEAVLADDYPAMPGQTTMETWVYQSTGIIRRYTLETVSEPTEGFGPVLLNELREYLFDAGGRLTRFTSGLQFDDEGYEQVTSAQYDAAGRLIHAEEHSDDGGRSDVEKVIYDPAGRLTRYELDEDGDGVAEQRWEYRYTNADWGFLFAGVSPFGHRRPLPDQPGISFEYIPAPNLTPR